MRNTGPFRFVILLQLIFCASLHAQGNEYRASTEPVYWVSDNPFRLFLIRGGDTIADPVRGISVFRETWLPTATGFDVERHSVDIGLSSRTRTDMMNIDRRGKVLTINGKHEYDDGEWDAFLRLPDTPLEVGLEWSDTLVHPTTGPHGEGKYAIYRRYRVARGLTGADGNRFEVEIEGRIEFALSMWMDSAAGHYRWFELEGPVEERFVFDAADGRLSERSWSMLLEGIGGDYNGTTSDTVPAGLRSGNTRYIIPAARAAALMGALQGPDTSMTFTVEGRPLFAHAFSREPARFVESMRHPDGRVERGEVELVDSRPARWTFTYAGPQDDARDAIYESDDAGLVAGGQRIEPPTTAWGIAEPGMIGTLIPSFELLDAPVGLPFSIYRPSTLRWDHVTLTSRRFSDFVLFVLVTESGAPDALILDADGDLLYAETTRADGTREVRVPVTEPQQTTLKRAFAELQAGN